MVTVKLETRHLNAHSLSYLVKMLVIPKNSIKFCVPFSSGKKNVLAQNEEDDFCRPHPEYPPPSRILMQ